MREWGHWESGEGAPNTGLPFTLDFQTPKMLPRQPRWKESHPEGRQPRAGR